MSRRPAKRYVAPVHYSPEELLRLQAADLYTDLRCAKRDGLAAYAAEVQAEIDALAAAHPVETALGAQLAAEWEDEAESFTLQSVRDRYGVNKGNS